MLAIDLRGQLERTRVELAAKTQDLRALAELQPPTIQASRFFRDCRPTSVTAQQAPAPPHLPPNQLLQLQLKRELQQQQRSSGDAPHGQAVQMSASVRQPLRQKQQQQQQSQQQSPLVRVIYLPHQRTEQLLQMVESLAAQVCSHYAGSVNTKLHMRTLRRACIWRLM
jgi:hypothetical protein